MAGGPLVTAISGRTTPETVPPLEPEPTSRDASRELLAKADQVTRRRTKSQPLPGVARRAPTPRPSTSSRTVGRRGRAARRSHPVAELSERRTDDEHDQ